MDRRIFMGHAALLSAAALPAVAAAQAQKKHEHHNHAHNHAGHKQAAVAGGSTPYEAVMESAADCVTASQVCLAHCLRLLAKGDTAMADCAQSVTDTIALCNALRDVAAHASALTPALAKVCIDACKRCADSCKPHAEHHDECRECYESCLDCIKACEKIAA